MSQCLSLKEYASNIYNQKRYMDGLWNNYTLVLLKNITLTERVYHHQVAICHSGKLTVSLFETMQMNIVRTGFLGPATIEYQPVIQGDSIIEIPSSCIDHQGVLDGEVSLCDKNKVFEHYLRKILPLYEYMAGLCFKDK